MNVIFSLHLGSLKTDFLPLKVTFKDIRTVFDQEWEYIVMYLFIGEFP